ncbi:MAG: hypothetical protein LBL66_09880 [Clostridiales bacterium]|nr:hypothetical protein [Clostridiales bacterium]
MRFVFCRDCFVTLRAPRNDIGTLCAPRNDLSTLLSTPVEVKLLNKIRNCAILCP